MTTFVYALSMVLLMVIMARMGAFKMVLSALDKRAEDIAKDIDRGRQLKEDAQNLLKEYQRDLALAEKDRVEIVKKAEVSIVSYADARSEAMERAVANQMRMGACSHISSRDKSA